MDRCSGVNTVESKVHGPVDVWTCDHFSGPFSQSQILDPELSLIYSTLNSSSLSDYSTHTPALSYSPGPSGMSTPSDSSNVPSPTDSALSPFFFDAPTPDCPTPEPVVKKPSHSRKRPPGHVPRPRNAFILFRSHHVAAQLIPQKVENDHRHISKIIGELWNKLSPAERLIWEQKADIEKERHHLKYPGYRYKPTKPDGVVKRRVKCRGAPAQSAYSSAPGIGKSNSAHEIVGSLNADTTGELHFGNDQSSRFIDQEERRKDKTRCARVAQLVQQGIVGEQLEAEAQRLGLDRGSVAAPTPQLQPSIHDPPGRRSQFHTNVDILRALQEEDNRPAFIDSFASSSSLVSPQDDMIPLDSIVISSSLSGYDPAQAHTSLSAEVEDDLAPPAIASATPRTDDALYASPHYRARSLPLGTPPLASLASKQQLLPVALSARQSGTDPTTLVSTRPSSSSSLRRQHRLYYPYPRREQAQNEQVNGNPDSDSDLSTFDHVSYYSPTNTPPEQFLSPHVCSRLQLDDTIHYSNATSPVSQPGTTSPLYGIDLAHSGRSQEPIDLSAMYDQEDNATGHEAPFHSTYAINTGNVYSFPVTPAPNSNVPVSQQLTLACKPVPDNTTSPNLDVGSGPSPTYYGWQSPFGSDLGYPRETEYEASTSTNTYEGIPHIYYPDNPGARY